MKAIGCTRHFSPDFLHLKKLKNPFHVLLSKKIKKQTLTKEFKLVFNLAELKLNPPTLANHVQMKVSIAFQISSGFSFGEACPAPLIMTTSALGICSLICSAKTTGMNDLSP